MHSLRLASIPTTYVLLPSLSLVLPRVSLCLLGTHALLSNGAMFSRAGTALVAMMLRERSVPVVCCCETYKFSERVMLDSIVGNERGQFPFLSFFFSLFFFFWWTLCGSCECRRVFPMAMADQRCLPPLSLCGFAATPLPLLPTATPLNAPTTTTTASSSAAGGKSSASSTASAAAASSPLQPPPNLSPLSLLYDVSRPEDVTVVITEAGLIPVQSVPVLLRDYKPVQGRNS